MNKPESVGENKTYRILWDLEIQIDHQIPARKPDLVITTKKKKKRKPVNFGTFSSRRITEGK